MPRGRPRLNAVQPEKPVEGNVIPQSAEPAMQALSPRAENVRRERRRRDDGDIDRMARMSLAIPHEIEERLRREGKVSRWVLNAPGRLMEMQADDWDYTPEVGQVSASQASEEKLVLMEKYKDWHDGDMALGQQAIADQEKAMERGMTDLNRRDGLVEVSSSGRNRISRDRG